MKTKFLLPMIAMIFAIGMSFATEKEEVDLNQDYYQNSSGTFMPLGREITCGTGQETCLVELPNGEVHEVYDAPDPNSIKVGDGKVRKLIE